MAARRRRSNSCIGRPRRSAWLKMARQVGPRASMRVWKKPGEDGDVARSQASAASSASLVQPLRRSGEPSATNGEFQDAFPERSSGKRPMRRCSPRVCRTARKRGRRSAGECWARDSANAGSKKGLGSMAVRASSSHSGEIASASRQSSKVATALPGRWALGRGASGARSADNVCTSVNVGSGQRLRAVCAVTEQNGAQRKCCHATVQDWRPQRRCGAHRGLRLDS